MHVLTLQCAGDLEFIPCKMTERGEMEAAATVIVEQDKRDRAEAEFETSEFQIDAAEQSAAASSH
jgi:hypothetical protein